MVGAQPRRISTLELFHPTGIAPRVLVLGGRDASALVAASSRDDEQADLVVVAPTRAECRASDWVARTAEALAEALVEDGVAFVVAPTACRRRLLRAVRAQRLVLGPTVLHLPSVASSRHVVGGRPAARYATACLVARSSWRGLLASLAFRVPGGTRLMAQADVASVVVRRREAAPPLFRWLAETAGDAPAERIVVTRTWRMEGGTFTVSLVDADAGAPRLVARVGHAPVAARESLGEERALTTLAPGAAAAGAAVPRLLASTRLDNVPVVVETGVAGRVAASALGERPRDVPAVLDRVLDWLLRWNRATATAATLTPSMLEAEVIRPARLVAPALTGGDQYVRLLEQLCDEAAGSAVMLAAAHDDLTMTNVLLGQGGSIGVVDWDTARVAALPLADFYYTVVDAHAASERYRDRARAFFECFSGTGRHTEDVRTRQSPFEQALGITAAVRSVTLHGCWLHHAANELARGEAGPFVQIVRQLADDPPRLAR